MTRFLDHFRIFLFIPFISMSFMGTLGDSSWVSPESSFVSTESAILTTNIQPGSVVDTHLTSSLEPSFSTNTLMSLTKLTSFATDIATDRVKRQTVLVSAENTNSCWFCYLYYTSSNSVKTGPSVSSETSTCWFCNLFFASAPSSISSTMQGSATESKLKLTTTLVASSMIVITTSSLRPNSFISTTMTKSVATSTRSGSSTSLTPSSSSCWFCDLFFVSSSTSVTSLHTVRTTTLFNDPTGILFKSTSSQSPFETNITSIIPSYFSVSALSVPSISVSVIKDTQKSSNSSASTSFEPSSSSCWFCDLLFGASSVKIFPSLSTPLYIDPVDLLFKSTISQSTTDTSSKPMPTLVTSSTATQFIDMYKTKDVEISTPLTATNAVETSSSPCWFCHLYYTDNDTLKIPPVAPTAHKFIDPTSSSFRGTSETVFEQVNTQPFSSTTEISQTTSSMTLFTFATIDSTNNRVTESPESTSPCWYCHLYYTSSMSSNLLPKPTLTESNSSCWYCDILLKPTPSQSQNNRTPVSTSIAQSAVMGETPHHESVVLSMESSEAGKMELEYLTNSFMTSSLKTTSIIQTVFQESMHLSTSTKLMNLTFTVQQASLIQKTSEQLFNVITAEQTHVTTDNSEKTSFQISSPTSTFSTSLLSPSFVSSGLTSSSELFASSSIQNTRTPLLDNASNFQTSFIKSSSPFTSDNGSSAATTIKLIVNSSVAAMPSSQKFSTSMWYTDDLTTVAKYVTTTMNSIGTSSVLLLSGNSIKLITIGSSVNTETMQPVASTAESDSVSLRLSLKLEDLLKTSNFITSSMTSLKLPVNLSEAIVAPTTLTDSIGRAVISSTSVSYSITTSAELTASKMTTKLPLPVAGTLQSGGTKPTLSHSFSQRESVTKSFVNLRSSIIPITSASALKDFEGSIPMLTELSTRTEPSSLSSLRETTISTLQSLKQTSNFLTATRTKTVVSTSLPWSYTSVILADSQQSGPALSNTQTLGFNASIHQSETSRFTISQSPTLSSSSIWSGASSSSLLYSALSISPTLASTFKMSQSTSETSPTPTANEGFSVRIPSLKPLTSTIPTAKTTFMTQYVLGDSKTVSSSSDFLTINTISSTLESPTEELLSTSKSSITLAMSFESRGQLASDKLKSTVSNAQANRTASATLSLGIPSSKPLTTPVQMSTTFSLDNSLSVKSATFSPSSKETGTIIIGTPMPTKETTSFASTSTVDPAQTINMGHFSSLTTVLAPLVDTSMPHMGVSVTSLSGSVSTLISEISNSRILFASPPNTGLTSFVTSSVFIESSRPVVRTEFKNSSSSDLITTSTVSLSVDASLLSISPSRTISKPSVTLTVTTLAGRSSETMRTMTVNNLLPTTTTSSDLITTSTVSLSVDASLLSISPSRTISKPSVTLTVTTIAGRSSETMGTMTVKNLLPTPTTSVKSTSVNVSSSYPVLKSSTPSLVSTGSIKSPVTINTIDQSRPVSTSNAMVSVPAESSMISISPSSARSAASVTLITSTLSAVINASTAGEAYWVETVLRVAKTVDVSTDSFKNTLEGRLAEAYNEAFRRQRLIEEGNFDHLQMRKRKRRFTQVGDAVVHVQHISREPDSTRIAAAYSVQRSGSVLQPLSAIEALSTLDTQELAIILRHVVEVNAEPYIKIVTPAPATVDDSMSKLWIIGAVVGPVLAVIIIIWLALCIYLKCCRKKAPEKLEEDGEPQLTSIRNTETEEISKFSKAYDNQAYTKLPEQNSRFDKKSRTYEVNPAQEPEYIETFKKLEVTPLSNTENKPSPEPSVTMQNGRTHKENVQSDPESRQTPEQKKKKRNRSIEPLGNGSADKSPRKSNSDQSFLLQSSLSGDDEELKEHIGRERMKNKNRLREKQKKRKDDEADLEAQREIDKILGTSHYGLPDVFVNQREREQTQELGRIRKWSRSDVSMKSDSPNHAKVSRQDSGVSNEPLSGEESLEEARKRMHQLLDDAFTLISPRGSFQENDISAIQKMQVLAKRHGDKISTSSPDQRHENSRSKISTVHLDSTRDLGDFMKHESGVIIKHEPMHFDSGYSYKDSPLETWSPYRASDQVALISMPNKVDTKLGGPKTKFDERSATSKTSKRPAANFEIRESNRTEHVDKYTGSSPQPIVLRTKDLASYVNVNSDKDAEGNAKIRHNSLGKYAAMTSINGDVYLSASTTTLSKQKARKGSHEASLEQNAKLSSNGDDIELKPVKRKSSTSLQNRRTLDKKNGDEVDVICDIQSTETSDDLIKSLREELQQLKGSYNFDSKSSKRSPKSSGMTEIV